MSKPTIKIDEIKKEILGYIANNPSILNGAVLSAQIELNKHAKLITKVRGEYTTLSSLIGHVVQAFSSEWTEIGQAQFRAKQAKSYHQKVNFAIKPADILNTIVEYMYDEGKDLKDKSVTKLIIEQLKKKIISDVDILSQDGIYDEAKAFGDNTEFGFSMDGINEVHSKMLSNTKNPCYQIPIDAIDDNNIIDVITSIERKLPKDFKKLVKKIFISQNNQERYILAYEDRFGGNTDYKKGDKLKTRLGKREIVTLDNMDDDKVVLFVDGNLCRFIDVVENPATITDVQKQDYKLKLFGEFSLGYDYAMNELVIVASPEAPHEGLGNDDLNKAIYPKQFVTINK